MLHPTVPSLVFILPLNDEICPEDVVMDPPSILPVVDIDTLVVIIQVDDMLHCEVPVPTDFWSPSEDPFLCLITPSM